MINIDYKAPPTLSRFLESNAFIRSVVGPVGSGKSSASIVELLRRASEQAPGPDGLRRTRWAIIRNTYRQLQDTTRKTFEQWVPEQLGEWREQAFTFEMSFGDVRAEIMFRALDRTDDVNKVLSLELTGAYINEMREIPKEIFDALQGRVGRYPSKIQGGATWFGIWGDSNPWHTGHWAYNLFNKHLPEDFELFEQPGGRTPEAENIENLPPRYYERLAVGKDSDWIKSYIDGQYPSNNEGSIYGLAIDLLEKRGGVWQFDHPRDGVYTTWDLGISDATAIWFWRVNHLGMPDVIDHYEARGQSLSHYIHVLEERRYGYVKHFLPHDARNRTFVTGASAQNQLEAAQPGKVAITPSLSVADGIAAGRWLLEQPGVQFHSRVADALQTLREYSYEWDDDLKCFSRNPRHDWTSHTADAWRGVACVAKLAGIINAAKHPPPRPPPQRVIPVKATLEELFKDREASRSKRPRRL